MGTPARRWLTIVTSATTSAPASGSASPSGGKEVVKHTLEPCSGKSSGASGAIASSGLMTAGSGP